MNLKESFRYQNFLDDKLNDARFNIENRTHALKVTKVHFKSKANPEAEDVTEVVEVEDFIPNDEVVAFMCWLVAERTKLTEAICAAKSSLDFSLDAAIEANKFRQYTAKAVKSMLRYTPSKKVEQGRDYKFNVEGNQTPYVYDIETSFEEAFNRDTAKKVVRNMITAADKTSAEIDSAMINTVVNYTPVFDVNDSFEDVMAEFVEKVLPTFTI